MSDIKWHRFESRDPRRPLVVLIAIAEMGDRATVHYVAEAIAAQNVEVIRSIGTLQRIYRVKFKKIGSLYRIEDWGVCDPAAVRRIISA